MHIELTGCNTARYGSIIVNYERRSRGSPLCDLARLLISRGSDPSQMVRITRGKTLCFKPLTLGFWAGKYAAEPDSSSLNPLMRKWTPPPASLPSGKR